MKRVKLKEICRIVSGATPKRNRDKYWGGDIPWVTPKEISLLEGAFLFDSVEKITEVGYKSCSTEILPVNSLLMSSRAPIGLFAINKIPVCTNQGFKSLIPSHEINVLFLYYYLKFHVEDIKSRGRGATFKEISKSIVENYPVYMPPKPDQTRIATLLSKVESLIAKRKESIVDLDELLKSTFLEMFGDPVRNDMGWDKPELKQFGKIITGNTPSRKIPENYSSDYIEWIKTDNILNDQIYVGKAAENLSERGAEKARIIEPGTLLVVCIAGSIESIGRSALTDRRVAFNQQINAIQPRKDINSLYLYELFKILKKYVQYHATKGMKKILTKGDFQKIRMVKPPINFQNQFATIVEKVEALKEKYQNSLNDFESLYGALSQKAFKGELNLSRIPIPVKLKPKNITTAEPEIGKPDLTVQDEPVKAPKTREQILHRMFNGFISDAKNGALFLDNFWQKTEETFMDLMDDDAPPLGAADYDQVRDWLFDMLAQGKVDQVFNEQENRMEIRSVS